jgi:hypothetical protein
MSPELVQQSGPRVPQRAPREAPQVAPQAAE